MTLKVNSGSASTYQLDHDAVLNKANLTKSFSQDGGASFSSVPSNHLLSFLGLVSVDIQPDHTLYELKLPQDPANESSANSQQSDVTSNIEGSVKFKLFHDTQTTALDAQIVRDQGGSFGYELKWGTSLPINLIPLRQLDSLVSNTLYAPDTTELSATVSYPITFTRSVDIASLSVESGYAVVTIPTTEIDPTNFTAWGAQQPPYDADGTRKLYVRFENLPLTAQHHQIVYDPDAYTGSNETLWNNFVDFVGIDLIFKVPVSDLTDSTGIELLEYVNKQVASSTITLSVDLDEDFTSSLALESGDQIYTFDENTLDNSLNVDGILSLAEVTSQNGGNSSVIVNNFNNDLYINIHPDEVNAPPLSLVSLINHVNLDLDYRLVSYQNRISTQEIQIDINGVDYTYEPASFVEDGSNFLTKFARFKLKSGEPTPDLSKWVAHIQTDFRNGVHVRRIGDPYVHVTNSVYDVNDADVRSLQSFLSNADYHLNLNTVSNPTSITLDSVGDFSIKGTFNPASPYYTHAVAVDMDAALDNHVTNDKIRFGKIAEYTSDTDFVKKIYIAVGQKTNAGTGAQEYLLDPNRAYMIDVDGREYSIGQPSNNSGTTTTQFQYFVLDQVEFRTLIHSWKEDTVGSRGHTWMFRDVDPPLRVLLNADTTSTTVAIPPLGVSFLDSGDSAAPYSADEVYDITFQAPAGEHVSITLNDFDIEVPFDRLGIQISDDPASGWENIDVVGFNLMTETDNPTANTSEQQQLVGGHPNGIAQKNGGWVVPSDPSIFEQNGGVMGQAYNLGKQYVRFRFLSDDAY